MLEAPAPAPSAPSIPVKISNSPAGTSPHPTIPYPTTDAYPSLGSPGPDPQSFLLLNHFFCFLNYIYFLDYKSDTEFSWRIQYTQKNLKEFSP